MIGRTLGHDRIESQLGQGGMGVVYRARDLRLERDVALKVLPAGLLADETARKRFRKEALALSPSPPSTTSTPRTASTYRHRAVQAQVPRAIQRPHPALVELLFDPAMGYGTAWHIRAVPAPAFAAQSLRPTARPIRLWRMLRDSLPR